MNTTVIEVLFSSKTLAKLLDLFFLNPKNSYYLRQIQTITGLSLRSLQVELEKLNKLNILGSRKDGNRRYFYLNENHYLYNDLKNIILKTTGIATILKNIFDQNSRDISFAFIYGSYAKGDETAQSDIDICVLGSISVKELYDIIGTQKAYMQREINFSVYTTDEFKIKYKDNHHFTLELVNTKKLFIVGTENEFKQFIESE